MFKGSPANCHSGRHWHSRTLRNYFMMLQAPLPNSRSCPARTSTRARADCELARKLPSFSAQRHSLALFGGRHSKMSAADPVHTLAQPFDIDTSIQQSTAPPLVRWASQQYLWVSKRTGSGAALRVSGSPRRCRETLYRQLVKVTAVLLPTPAQRRAEATPLTDLTLRSADLATGFAVRTCPGPRIPETKARYLNQRPDT